MLSCARAGAISPSRTARILIGFIDGANARCDKAGPGGPSRRRKDGSDRKLRAPVAGHFRGKVYFPVARLGDLPRRPGVFVVHPVPDEESPLYEAINLR